MKVSRIGRPKPVMSLSGLLGGGGGGGGNVEPGPSGQVPTANGSNAVAWGSNVAIIAANGSNALLGPFVNLASGSNIIFTHDSFPSNTLRIHSAGSGGGGSSNPADDAYVWMPLTSVASNTLQPELVWDGDNSLIPTLVPRSIP